MAFEKVFLIGFPAPLVGTKKPMERGSRQKASSCRLKGPIECYISAISGS